MAAPSRWAAADRSITVTRLYMANDFGSSGSHTLSGSGSLTVERAIIGVSGTAEFTQTGGTSHITNVERIGESGTGTYTQTGGTHTIDNQLYLGYWSEGVGTYALGNGTLTTKKDEFIGYGGQGTSTRPGGSITSSVAFNWGR